MINTDALKKAMALNWTNGALSLKIVLVEHFISVGDPETARMIRDFIIPEWLERPPTTGETN